MRGPKNEKQLSSLSTGYRAKKEANDLVVCSLVKKRHFSGLGFRFQPREEEEEVFVFLGYKVVQCWKTHEEEDLLGSDQAIN